MHQVPIPMAASVQESLVAKSINTTPLLYSPAIAPVDFFRFPRERSKMAGLSSYQDIFKGSWEGVIQTIAKDEFADAILQWMDRCKKWVTKLKK
jgi:hypothetical protein